MIINLFSIFDPSSSINYSLNWLRLIYLLIFIPNLYWIIPSRWNYIYIFILILLKIEFKVLIYIKINIINILIYISIFIFIILNNFLGIFSYIFTATSHLRISLSISLPIWISFILYGWINRINHIFIHLVPSGTPRILIPFIVIIETIRNIIRPGTLAVRLSANIIAGHLLIVLISSTGRNLSILLLLIILLLQSILVILELRVSIIQAYVFTVLRTLYRVELNYEKIMSTFSFSNFKSLTYFIIF